ncbi:MAG: ATP-dependent helicase [bacterium]|nr:ATP-dependent helicase [bacterium]
MSGPRISTDDPPPEGAPLELNQRQREAIAYRGGHLLLLAGPGTGKTETLARRAAALIDEARNGGHEQPEMLLLTFARKAARELRARVARHLRSGGRLPACSTFHAFALEVLEHAGSRAYGELGMLTPTKERLLVERVCRGVADEHPERIAYFTRDALRSRSFARDFANAVGRFKQARVSALEVFAAARGAQGQARAALAELAGLYQSYEQERERLRLRDFRDLVNEAIETLRGRPRAYAHVFVDELQDADPSQLELLQILAGAGAMVTAVGDPNQSIYRFRSAAPAAISDLQRMLTPHVVALDENRRCPPEILACVNRLAEVPAPLDPRDPPQPALAAASLTRSVAERSGEVRWLRCLDRHDEAISIAREIRRRIGAPRAGGGVLRYRDVAILLRSPERHAEAIALALRGSGIPVVRSGAAEFLADAAVDFVLAYLKALAAAPGVDQLLRLLSSPVVGVHAHALRFAQRRMARGADALSALTASAELSAQERARIARFARIFERHRSSWRRSGAGELVRSIAREHGVVAALVACAADDEAGAASAARLKALISLADDADAVAGRPPEAVEQLAHGAHELFTLLAEAEGAAACEGVHILSIHAAKGLEFPLVVVAGAVRGELPAPSRPDPLLGEAAQEALYHDARMTPAAPAVEQRE